MNEEQTEKLMEIHLTLTDLMDQLEEIIEEEQVMLDTMPDSKRTSKKRQELQFVINKMESAITHVDLANIEIQKLRVFIS